MTKKYKEAAKFLFIVSIILNFVPALCYLVTGFVRSNDAGKVILSSMSIVALILCVINVAFKKHLRSPLWILVLGIYICLAKIQTLLILISICTIIDEFIISPLYKKCKDKYEVNKVFDERMGITDGTEHTEQPTEDAV